MSEEKSLWDKMMGGPEKSQGSEPNYKNHPNYMKAQKRATEEYFKTGKQRPFVEYLNDPNLK